MPKISDKPKTITKPAKKAKVKGNGSAKVKAPRTDTGALMKEVMAWMVKGKTVSTREVVEGLKRTPGAKEGQPVFNALTKLSAEGKVKGEKKPNGWVWTKLTNK